METGMNIAFLFISFLFSFLHSFFLFSPFRCILIWKRECAGQCRWVTITQQLLQWPHDSCDLAMSAGVRDQGHRGSHRGHGVTVGVVACAGMIMSNEDACETHCNTTKQMKKIKTTAMLLCVSACCGSRPCVHCSCFSSRGDYWNCIDVIIYN